MDQLRHIRPAAFDTLPWLTPGFVGRASFAVCVGLLAANCAQQPQTRGGSRSSEIGAFPQAKYGKASPRVVSEDEDAPKGGGRYQVGRPYTVAGRTYYPSEKQMGATATGNASWYGVAFHGRRTANGEVFDRNSISAAHPTMPLPSYARVTNTRNNYSIIVRVNDRGPYHGGRIMDVSERVAQALEFKGAGTARIRYEYLGKASLAGSDDTKLMASLRTDGSPASTPGLPTGVMIASAETPSAPSRPVASLRPAANPPSIVAFRTVASAQQDDAEQGAQPAVVQTAALRVSEPAPAAIPQRVASAPLVAAPHVPQPPERPFDLGTIPFAGTPVPPSALTADGPARATIVSTPAPAGIVPPPRPRLASLSFAPLAGQPLKLLDRNPLAKLPAPKFVPTTMQAIID